MALLHPQIREVLRVMAEAGLRPIEDMTPAEAREQMEATSRARKAEPLPVGKVEERLFPGPGGDIRLRLYWPREQTAPVPAIVYFHGGGHVIGSLDTHDFIARNLCGGTGAAVVSVDYRMGPEYKFPAAVDDCFAALEWVRASAESLGVDPAGSAFTATAPGAILRRSSRCSPAMPAVRSCGCNRSYTRSSITASPLTAMTNTPTGTGC